MTGYTYNFIMPMISSSMSSTTRVIVTSPTCHFRNASLMSTPLGLSDDTLTAQRLEVGIAQREVGLQDRVGVTPQRGPALHRLDLAA